MSLIKLQGNASGTGAFTIAAPNGNTDRTLTLPDATGTVVTADASGNVGIGVASPSTRLHLSSSTQAYPLRVQVTAGSTAGIEFEDPTTGSSRPNIASRGTALAFETNSAERMRIDSSGAVLIGKSASSISTVGWQLEPSGGGSVVGTISSGTNEIFTFGNTSTGGTAQVDFRTANVEKGSISWNNTSTAFNTSSDYRLKENVQPMTGASERVLALKPVNFAWKVDGSRVDGFLAHEAQAVVPEAVTGAKDEVDDEGNPKYQGIDQSKLVPLLTAALQEALAEIANLKTRLTALEAN